jgi:hypothetical protein
MSTDPAVVGWFGEAAAATLHEWGGRIGALIVVCAGLWIVRRRRPWTFEEVWTFVALLVWIAGDIAINLNFTEAEPGKRWTSRLVLFLVLLSDYVVLRSRASNVVEELVMVEEVMVSAPEAGRDKT